MESCPLHCFDTADVESVWNIISSVITDAISLFVPVFQSHQSVWFITDLQHLCCKALINK